MRLTCAQFVLCALLCLAKTEDGAGCGSGRSSAAAGGGGGFVSVSFEGTDLDGEIA